MTSTQISTRGVDANERPADPAMPARTPTPTPCSNTSRDNIVTQGKGVLKLAGRGTPSIALSDSSDSEDEEEICAYPLSGLAQRISSSEEAGEAGESLELFAL